MKSLMGLLGLLSLAASAACLLLLPPDRAQAPDRKSVVLTRAEFARIGLKNAEPRYQQVGLPDTWHFRGESPDGHGRYRLHFTLDAIPEAPWAARIDRLALTREVRLNGEIIDSRDEPPEVWRHQHPMPALLALPSQRLRVGDNVLELDLRIGCAAGLSTVELGAQDALRQSVDRERLLSMDLPLSLNFAAAGLAVFLGLIWLQRRNEVVIGMYSLVCLMQALLDAGYYAETRFVHNDWVNWFFIATHGWSTALFGELAMRLTGRGGPGFMRTLRILCVVVWPVATAVAFGLGQALAFQTVGLPLLLLACIPPIRWLFLASKGSTSANRIWFFLGGALLFATSVHDYLLMIGNLPVTEQVWRPIVIPFVLGGFAWALVGRMVRALSEVERVNAGLESVVAERTAQLVAANTAKSRFLASASHDLRQPLHAISVLVTLLTRRGGGTELVQIIDRLGASVSGMQSLLNALLDMSRLDMGHEAPKFEPLAVESILTQLRYDFAPIAAERGLALRFRAHDGWVRSDAAMLGRVMSNLVSNALRYTVQGGVLVATRLRGEEIWFEVWDTGIGIAPEQQEVIFEEFIQLANPERSAQAGVGLGLAIVRRAVGLLGAGLELHSQPGRGSLFRLRVPRVHASMERQQQSLPDIGADPAGLFVLIVDDDEAIRFAMTALLRDLGCHVEAAAGSQEALTALQRHLREPDAVLMDYRLAGETGIEALEVLRANLREDLPAALITGEHHLPEAERLAATAVLMQKPLDINLLRSWLGGLAKAL